MRNIPKDKQVQFKHGDDSETVVLLAALQETERNKIKIDNMEKRIQNEKIKVMYFFIIICTLLKSSLFQLYLYVLFSMFICVNTCASIINLSIFTINTAFSINFVYSIQQVPN